MKYKYAAFALVAAAVFVMAPLGASGDGHDMLAQATLHNAEGAPTGTAILAQTADGVKVIVQVFGLPPGTHALHIHDAGSCESPGFKSAMGHFNPYGKKHGLMSPDGPHAGDLPNILVGPDGTGTAVALAPLATLEPGPNSVFKEGGTAVMIHDGPDDYLSDPAGAAGKRIACGVIERWRG